MANTVVGFNGKSPPELLPALGSYVPIIPFKATISGVTTSENISFPQLRAIRGAMVQVLDSGNNVATSDIDVTFSTNVLTLADGATFNLDAANQTIYGVVWGDAKA